MSRRTVLLWAVAAGALASGCFSLPADDVTFTCDVGGDASCPEAYSCEADGCCHRDGSKVTQNFGACRLGGTGGTGFSGGMETGTDGGTGTGTGTGG